MNIRPMLSGLKPGYGANYARQTTHACALADGFQFKPVVPDAAGSVHQLLITIVEDTDSLLKFLSASGSVEYAEVFSASASAQFMNDFNYSSYHTYVMIKQEITCAEQVLDKMQLKDDVVKTIPNTTQAEFERLYGTEFLGGMLTGGRYIGIIEIHGTSEQDQQDIRAAVGGSGYGVTANADIASKLSSATSHMDKTCRVLVLGGPPDILLKQDVEGIIKDGLNAFPGYVQKAPVIFNGLYQPYADSFQLNFKESGNQTSTDDMLEELGRQYTITLKYRNDLDFVIANYYNEDIRFSWHGKDISAPLANHTGDGILSLPILQKEKDNANAVLDTIDKTVSAVKLGNDVTMPDNTAIAPMALPTLSGFLESVYKGTIVMWSGKPAEIPPGWLLCDGNNGTPDLRDRFIKGASTDGDSGKVGGADTHSHGGTTDQAGQHSHMMPTRWYARGFNQGTESPGVDTANDNPPSVRSQEDGGHQHGFSTDLVDHTPKWYSLCFIMKT